MQKLKYKLDRRTLENIYFTFVRPKLEYASIIWDDCTEGNKLKLENVQLGFAELLLGLREAQVMSYYTMKRLGRPFLVEEIMLK